MRIAVLPGDGIGKDVTEASLPVFDKLKLPIELYFGDLGWEFWKKEGTPVPERTWQLINECDTVLVGAVTSKPQEKAEQELDKELQNSGLKYVSPVIQLRQRLNLFANIRPIQSIYRDESQDFTKFDFIVVRENTEGLYAGLDFYPIPETLYEFVQKQHSIQHTWQMKKPEDGAISCRLVTRDGLCRLLQYSYELAQKKGIKKITWADKPNVMRSSGQFVLDLIKEIGKYYPNIECEVKNVDAVAMWMVKKPEQFEMIVCENQFGDILSDLGAGIMGGLGLAASANIGKNKSYFEPVHGSAPKYEGKNIVNPSAMFLTISMMLEHVGYLDEANRIKKAVFEVINLKECVTKDLNGTATTIDMAKSIIERC